MRQYKYERKCKNCGETFHANRMDAVFCGRSCHAKYCRKECKSEPIVKVRCPYNEGVECMRVKCETCGWNPDVAKRRMEEYAYEGV